MSLFTLSIDAARNALEIRIEGFWSRETFIEFRDAIPAQVRHLTRGGRPHCVKVNVSATALQTQEVVGLLKDLITHETPQPRKMAFVATTALSRMQTRRLLLRPNVRMFENEADAISWLDDR